MARDFAMTLLVLLLIQTSTRADDSFIDEADDPNHFSNFYENGEDEILQDLSQVDDDWLTPNEEEDVYRQMWPRDERAAEQEVKTSDIDFEAYNKNGEGSQRNRFDESRRRRLQSKINAPESRPIRNSPSDEFKNQRPQSKRRGDRQLKGRNFRKFGDLDTCCKGAIKRNHFENPTLEDLGRIRTDNPDDNCTGTPGNLSVDCKGLLKRSHFESLRSRREETHTTSSPTLNPSNKAHLNRNNFESTKGSKERQMKRNHLDGLRRSRPYKERYGDIGTVQTEGRPAHRNLHRIQRSNFYDIENDQKEGLNIDGEQDEVDDYNSDEQFMETKYIDGLVIRQIYDDQSQNLQPELDESPPYPDSNLSSDFDGDIWIPKERIYEVHANADKDMESRTAEDEEDETLQDLHKVDERQNEEEDGYRQMLLGDEKAQDQEVRNSDTDFEANNENAERSQINRLDRSRSSRRDTGNDALGQMKRDVDDKCEGKKGVLSPKCHGLVILKRNHFESFTSRKGDLNNNCDQTVPNDCDEGHLKRNHFRTSRGLDDGQMKRNHFESSRSQRESTKSDLTLNGKAELKRNHFERIRSQDDGEIKRNQFQNPICPKPEDCTDYKGKKGTLDRCCIGQLKRNHFESFRSRREDTKKKLTSGNKGALKKKLFKTTRGPDKGQIKRNHLDGLRRSRSNNERYGDIGTLQTDESQTHRNLHRIQGSNLYDIENDQREGRESDGDQVEANDYNSDEQLMRTKYTDGLVIRQIYEDPSQNLQPELEESPPNPDSNLPSDFDGDDRISMKKRFEVHPNADGDKESNTEEETSSDELLALLVNLVREKRQKESPET